MDILQRDEFFEKREKNREKYRELIRKHQVFEADCHKYFVDNKDMISNKEYIDIYEMRLKELCQEKKELDLEWDMLTQELYKLILPSHYV